MQFLGRYNTASRFHWYVMREGVEMVNFKNSTKTRDEEDLIGTIMKIQFELNQPAISY